MGRSLRVSISYNRSTRVLLLTFCSEIMEQVWANVQANCDLDYDLVPANNITGGIGLYVYFIHDIIGADDE
jgi:hypothetical protein